MSRHPCCHHDGGYCRICNLYTSKVCKFTNETAEECDEYYYIDTVEEPYHAGEPMWLTILGGN